MSNYSRFKMVAEFQEKFGTPKDPEFWLKLVHEELVETEEALTHLLKEVADLEYVTSGLYNCCDNFASSLPEETRERLERVEDFLGRAFDEVMQEAFERVHKSNMSKLGDDGKPLRREDGKVLKGPNYAPPDLTDLVRGV